MIVDLASKPQDTGSVLVLNSLDGWKPAMLINNKGDQAELSCFERDEATEAVKSCSINWQNQWYVFGGESNKRQITKLHGHKLERLGFFFFSMKQLYSFYSNRAQ